jgi:FixJ family two-component response regulator
MPFGGPNSERALILAPRGRDAEIASALFQEAGWATLICADIGRLCEEFPKGAAFAVVAEEALTTNELAAFGKCLEAQPNWSDFPVVILTAHDETPGRNEIAIQLQNVLGNVSFLERPFHPTTLISVARAALRSRRRQYQTRDCSSAVISSRVNCSIERKIYLLSFRRLPQPACRRVLVERAFLIVFTPWPEHKI